MEYETLTTAEAAILDAHHASCYGEALGFDFTERESGTTYSDCHYEKYERSRMKSWVQIRRVTITKRP
jgi:hypothetical protein